MSTSRRYKPTEEEKATRSKARWSIIQAANNYVIRFRYKPVLRGMRQLRWCVFICRQHKLVKSSVLKEAGFNG